MLPGGATDKFGNYYEGIWTVYVILDILKEKADFIRLEPVNEYEAKGVEFYIEKNGWREYHQVKSQNAATGSFSLKKLSSMGILANFKEHLERESNSKCVFISSDGSNQLRKLVQRSNAGKNLKEFKEFCIQDKDSLKWFDELVEIWDVLEDKTYGFLKRIEVRTIDPKTLKDDVINHLDTLISGDSENCLDVLAQYMYKSIHKELDGMNLWNYLNSRGFSVLDWNRDLSLFTKINESNKEVADYLKQTFICDTFLEKNEVGEIFDLLQDESMVLLSGDANSGKSSILYEVLNQSDSQGYTPYIMKIDNLGHINTKKDLKDTLELPETPEKVLANISKASKGLLIIDQLDAVSQYSGRNADIYDKVIFSIIENSKLYDNLKVLIACRTVDLKNDYRFKKLIKENEKNIVNVSGLSENSIVKTLERFGIAKNKLNNAQIQFLKNPLALYLQIELVEDVEFKEGNSLSQIYAKYWKKKKRCFSRKSRSSWIKVLSYVSDYMSSKKSLFIPLNKLEDYEDEINILLTENILKKLRKNIYFFHESFFDYTFAKLFSDKEKDTCEYLLENDQYLFRRAQVRQILTYKREEGEESYYKDIEKLIENPNIRYHIKDLVFRFINSLKNPSMKEFSCLKKNLLNEQSEYFDESWKALISTDWVIFLKGNNLFQLYSKEKNEEALKKVIELMIRFSSLLKKDQLNILKDIYKKNDSLKDFIVNQLYSSIRIENLDQLELYGDFLEYGVFDEFLSNLNPYTVSRENSHVFIGWLDKVLKYSHKKSKVDDKEIFELLPNNLSLKTFLKEENQYFYYREYIEVIDLFLVDSKYLEKNNPYNRFRYNNLLDEEIFDVFINCFGELAKNNEKCARSKISEYLSYKNKNYDRMVLKILKKAPDIFREDVVNFILDSIINDKKKLDLELYEYYLFMEKVSKYFTSVDIKRLEVILAYYPNWERPNKRSYEQFNRSSVGYSQLYILSGMDKSKLSSALDLRLKELKRKFTNENIEEYVRQNQKTMASIVPSPISLEKLKLMNDENLLKFLKAFNQPDSRVNYDINQLSWDLKKIAKEDPRRFYHLIKKLPLETYRSHINEIILGMAESNSLSEKDVNDILEYTYINFKGISGNCIARVIENYTNYNYNEFSLKVIKYFLLEHPDPDEDHWKNNINGRTPYSNGINCTRGQMAIAVGTLLNDTPKYLSKFKPIVERITNDRTTAVKSCSLGALIAYYNNNEKEFALKLLRKLIDSSDEEILDTNELSHFLGHVLYNQFDDFKDILYKMLNSNNSKIKEVGALHTGKLILNERGEDSGILQYCYDKNDIDVEKGLSKVFSANILNFKDACNVNLKKLFDSNFKDARNEASRFVYNINSEKLEDYLELYRSYISSLAFRENIDSFLHELDSWNDITFKMPAFIFEICKKVFDEHKQNKQHLSLDKLLILICKIYEESDEDKIIEECLDIIDTAFREKVYQIENTLSEFERN